MTLGRLELQSNCNRPKGMAHFYGQAQCNKCSTDVMALFSFSYRRRDLLSGKAFPSKTELDMKKFSAQTLINPPEADSLKNNVQVLERQVVKARVHK